MIVIIDRSSSNMDMLSLQLRLDSNRNTLTFKSVKDATDYLQNNEVEQVIISEQVDFTKLLLINQNLTGKIFMVNYQTGHIGFSHKVDNKVAGFFNKYGLTRILDPFLSRLLLAWCHIAWLLGIKYCFGLLFTSRIGHLITNTNAFIRRARAEGYNRIVGVNIEQSVASPVIMDMYKRLHLDKLYTSEIWWRLITEKRFVISKFYKDVIYMRDSLYPEQTLPDKPLEFSWTEEQEKQGQELLTKLGINTWYVCIHARDSEYLDKKVTGVDWHYHDFRDADINTYKEAIKYIISQGGKVVRVNMAHKTPLIDFEDSNYIDYGAMESANDFGYIYLISKCKFFIGGPTGITEVARMFKKPVAMCNWVHYELMTSFRQDDLFIPKKCWVNKWTRYLTLSEILSHGIGRYIKSDQYKQAGIDLEANTADEIYKLAKELNEKIDFTWLSSESERELQDKFKAIINQEQYLCNQTQGMIASSFLREHKEWGK